MHLKSCCALFLLALVACQAAPSPKEVIEKSISEAETFTKNGIQLEEIGTEKERAKKSATTFCVEVRSGKPEQVPCRQEVRPQGIIQQETSKPLVIVQPIPIPAPVPVVEYPKQPIIIQPQPPQPQQPQQLQPSQEINVIHQSQQTANINSQALHTQPQVPQHVAPVPAPVPVQAPASAPIPIINIVPPAPAPAPCDKPTIVQPQQPQQIHTVHVIHPQLQPTPRPSMTVIHEHELKPQKEPQPSLIPKKLPPPFPSYDFIKQREPTCQNCNRPLSHLSLFVQPPPTAFIDVVPQHVQSDCKNVEEGAFECNCRSENRIPMLTPYTTSRFLKVQKPPLYSDVATFESMPYRSSLISTENNPIMMLDQPSFASEGVREAEGRRHKKYPLNLSVQFPIIYPESDNSLKYYEPVYRPSYTNPNFYSTYSSSYGNYGNYGTYGTSYPPVSYNSQTSASGVPAVTVNAGPFYREAQHIDSLSPSNELEMLPREALSITKDITQLKNEQEITQNKKNIMKEAMS